jgi:actin-related protein 10
MVLTFIYDFSLLMTDPKSRKVIIVEHPLLPISIKDLMARILFDNLNVGCVTINQTAH